MPGPVVAASKTDDMASVRVTEETRLVDHAGDTDRPWSATVFYLYNTHFTNSAKNRDWFKQQEVS